jgi:Peptidase inhibitor I9
MDRFSPVRRSLIAAVGVLLGTVVLALAAAASASGDDKKRAHRGDTDSPKVDRNRDKLSDDLEARLAEATAREHVNVIVTLNAQATAGRVETVSDEVGGFSVGKRIEVIDGFSATVTKAEAEALAKLPIVRRVEENSVVRAPRHPSASRRRARTRPPSTATPTATRPATRRRTSSQPSSIPASTRATPTSTRGRSSPLRTSSTAARSPTTTRGTARMWRARSPATATLGPTAFSGASHRRRHSSA